MGYFGVSKLSEKDTTTTAHDEYRIEAVRR